MRYVLVQFVGKGAPRIDNVRHTNRVWPHEGSVLRIPENEAQSYLDYSGVWKMAGTNTVESEDVEKANSAANVEMLAGLIGMLNKRNIRVIADACVAYLQDEGEETADLTESLKPKRKAA